jgi:hypothetical protein
VKGRKRILPLVVTAVALLLIAPAAALADAPPGPYFNGFEQNTAGWSNFSGGTIHREPSGYVSSTGYASGIPSASGSFHARLRKDPSPDSCTFGGGTADIYRGPVTDWGGYSSIFPTGGYTTRLDIYLDTAWAATHLDQRFDWSSAINNTSGSHRRDFIFNAGTEPTGFVISASNNGDRCSSFPGNPARTPVHIIQSGWYTFEHTFTGVAGGPLVVNLRLINKATSAVVGTWMLADPTDIIGTTVGGNRNGWFVQNEINDLAIDNSERTGIVNTPGCEIKINNGGSITTLLGDHATFGGNAKVSMAGEVSGQQTYQDHRMVMPVTFKSLSVQFVTCTDDRDEAEIYGVGSVNGEGGYQYRIKLKDAGEPGTGDMYGITIGSAPPYASGDQTLDGGNVQIR